MLSLLVLKIKGEKVSQEGLSRDWENMYFTCTFSTMSVMTDKSPRQITPVAYQKR